MLEAATKRSVSWFQRLHWGLATRARLLLSLLQATTRRFLLRSVALVLVLVPITRGGAVLTPDIARTGACPWETALSIRGRPADCTSFSVWCTFTLVTTGSMPRSL